MKTKSKILALLIIIIGVSIVSLSDINNKNLKSKKIEKTEETASIIEEPIREIVYDNMTIEELSDKLNRSLSSTLEGYGYLFASYSLEKGVDPYMAVAIVLHETGCRWGCSTLVKSCNNVGGQKGSPSCNGGSYMSYPTLEAGIKGYIDNLYNGYISKGLITPEQIGPKYAVSTTWASKINWYIEDIKAN